MMWPFRKNKDAETIRALRVELDEAWDSYASQVQHTGMAKAALALIQKPMTEPGLDEIAKSVTDQIADIYAAGWSGVHGRDAAVYSVIRSTVLKATRGDKDARL